ncbi:MULTISPECIES: 4'-phosphopantetheinyl transferase family protein [Pedobacter]|uniref:4'-phosphopantetheinyl transferase family protein n=1 Tax=Pedobacter TaxID=84567 RepID=UPI00210D0504|nr:MULTISPECIES: 4'-phosphopantetheinyl transferase superfamily protein [unclassified Pedobacter]
MHRFLKEMPVVFNKDIDDDTMLAVWKIEETEAELLASLQLRQHEHDVIATLNHGKRLLHWLSTRVLLRKMLNTAEYIDCQLDEHGKPYLPGLGYHISLSHSYDYAAVMVGKTRKVGVDIELIKHKIKGIRHKFLSDSELSQKQIGDNTEGLYVCWCAKEAIYKWNGRRGLEFKQDIHIKPFKLKQEGTLRAVADLPEGPAELEVTYFKMGGDYMLGYVVG